MDDYRAIINDPKTPITVLAHRYNVSTTRIWRLRRGEWPVGYVPLEKVNQPIVGFRMWYFKREQIFSRGHMVNETFQLTSASGLGRQWNIGRPSVAACTKGTSRHVEAAPVFNCSCGFWFYKTLEGAEEHSPRQFTTENKLHLVGACLARGRIIECEYGYRTQYAQPIALARPASYSSAKEYLLELKAAELIGVPLVTRDGLLSRYSPIHEMGLQLPPRHRD